MLSVVAIWVDRTGRDLVSGKKQVEQKRIDGDKHTTAYISFYSTCLLSPIVFSSPLLTYNTPTANMPDTGMVHCPSYYFSTSLTYLSFGLPEVR